MVEVEVAVLGQPALDAIGEHPAVLARAIVRERRIGGRRRNLAPRLVVPGGMRTASEIACCIAGAREHVGDGLYMPSLARMASAQQRDLRRRVAEALDPAPCDERHRL